MLERYHNIGGHLRLDPEGTLTSYADAQATIADLQGQVEAARKKVEEMNAWVSAMSTANIATMTHTSEMQERALEAEQRVAQLEGERADWKKAADDEPSAIYLGQLKAAKAALTPQAGKGSNHG